MDLRQKCLKSFKKGVKMKRLLIFTVVGLLLAGSCIAGDILTIGETRIVPDFPNLQLSYLYNVSQKATGVGLLSTLLEYKFLNVKVGWIGNQDCWIFGAGIDLNKLKGLNLKYAWQNIIDLNMGCFTGVDFKTPSFTVGLYAVMIDLRLK